MGAFARAGPIRREELSFAGTLARAGGIARRLRKERVGPGDRVLLAVEDGPIWIASFAGCLATGAVAVPLEPGSDEGIVERVARRCGARLLLRDGPPGGPSFPGLSVDVRSVAPGSSGDLDPVADPEPDSLAEIVFTSGTTAAPRGVMITHGNILSALAGIEAGILKRSGALRLVRPITILNLVPLSHLFGQALGLFIPAILGARVVFSPSRPARAILELAKRERATVLVAVPRHLAGLRDRMETLVEPPRGELSSRWWIRAIRSLPLVREHGWRLRVLVVGGARLDPELERFFKELGYLLVQGYGLTETAPIISVSNPFDPRIGLVGRPSRAQEVRIAGDGEILVRGGNVTPGYYEDDGATREAIREGWLRTGDLGCLEPDGSLRILGRKKEVIVTGEGQNVFPDEVDAALRAQEAIADGASFAVRGDRGEEVHAAVIPEGGIGEPAVQEGVAAANASLAPHQRLRGWAIWPDLDFPRTSTGKVIRRRVASAVEARRRGGAPSQEGALAGAAGAGPLELLRNLAGEEARADQRFGSDLGVSSIDVAELAASIEDRYQVAIEPAAIHDDVSLAELLDHARTRAGSELDWPMPRWARALPARIARSLLQTVVVAPGLRTFVRLEVRGGERTGPLQPPFLIAANHQSHFDVPILLFALSRSLRRRVAVAMQPGYFEPWLRGTAPFMTRLHLGWHYRVVSLLLNTFPFPRSAAFRVAMRYAGEMADLGWSILVFPEGELSRDGAIHEFRAGVGVLARELNLPVLPARIEGAFRVIPRGRWFPRTIRGPVTVSWGEPVRRERGEEPDAFAARLEAAVRELA